MLSKKRYTFYLKNGKHIIITDIKQSEPEKFKKFLSTISEAITSTKICKFETNSDVLLIKPSEINAIQITFEKENINDNNTENLSILDNLNYNPDNNTYNEETENIENLLKMSLDTENNTDIFVKDNNNNNITIDTNNLNIKHDKLNDNNNIIDELPNDEPNPDDLYSDDDFDLGIHNE